MKPKLEKKIITRKNSTIRFVKQKDGNVVDQYGRIFTSADGKGKFVGCGYATH